jgi:nucleotide-binding universal stress UspA family protein
VPGRDDRSATDQPDRDPDEESVVPTPTALIRSTETPSGEEGDRHPVVIGLDGSEGARAALLWGLAEAARRGVGVEVFSAFPVDFYWTDAYLVDAQHIDSVRADTRARAEALVAEARRDPAVAAVPGSADVPVQVVVAAGAPAEHLVQRAADADLLVVGSRGRSAIRSTLIGSVALHCVAHAPCSVVVAHAGVPSTGAAAGKVVVGLDDSDMGRAALTAAVTEAARLGADVEAVVAHEAPDHWSDMYTLMAPPSGETHEHAVTRGEQIVAEVLGTTAGGTAPAVHVSAE